MNIRHVTALTATVLLFSASLAAALSVGELRCEHAVDPLGIDTPAPRLFWQLADDARGARQGAYRVLVAGSPELLEQDRGDLWDSGKVTSDQSVFVAYAGRPLASRQPCFWKVRVWDQHNQPSDWSQPASWSMGLLTDSDWHGRWIASDLELMPYQQTLKELPDFAMEPETEIWARAAEIRTMTADVTEAPAVWLRKEFDLARDIRRATVTIAGLGLFELHVNGRRISDHQLDPAPTDYEKRVFYLTHDVTDALRTGRNALGVVLGNGWFNLVTPHTLRFYTADYISPPQLRLDLHLEFADGSQATIGSDESWRFTTDGPIRYNCLLGGETVDARREMPGWSNPGFDDSAWQPARSAQPPRGRLASQQIQPVRKVKELPARSVEKNGDAWRFDLGVETVGWVRLSLRGQSGQEITIQLPGAPSHTLGRYQTGKYICRGQGEETFEPRFCYAGFRYVDVTGLDYQPEAADCVGQMVCTDLEPAGVFACSDERLNRIQEILLRTVRNYVVHIPNDPTREKAGWTQDMECGFYETVYNFRSARMYTKWQRDFFDIIHADGYMPPVAPGRFDGPTINGPWWGGAVIYGPWWLYQFYGDREILREAWPAMKAQFAYLSSIAQDNIVSWGLGDWMEVGSVRPVRTPLPLTSTFAYYWFACILRDTATLLDQPEDATRFAAAADEIRAACNREFLNPETGEYAQASQTSQLLALVLNVAPDDQRDLVRHRLAERIAADNYHLTTGFVGTPMLFQGLSDFDMPELAWRIATQTDYPSFIDAILNRGNTVMKEDWTGGLVQMPSLQGPIGTWFYYSLAGIRPGAPGFKKIVIKPETAGELTWVKAHHDCLFGRIASEWRRTDGQLAMTVTIPPNTSATIYVPAAALDQVREGDRPAARAPGITSARHEKGRAIFEAQPGAYHFTAPADTARTLPPGRR